MKLDALFIATHPDDIEITSAGTAIKLIKEGKKVGIVDLTQGELSTRGNLKSRKMETDKASKVMGIHYHFRDPGRGQALQDEPQQRHATDVHEGFRRAVCKRPQAGAEPRGQYHRFHKSLK